MIRFARLFLFAVFGHGLLALAAWALPGAAAGAVDPVARPLWVAVLLAAPVLYVLLGVSPRLPGRFLLPAIAAVAWRAVAGLPLPLYLGSGTVEAVLAVAEVAAASLGLARVRPPSGEAAARRPRFSGRRAAGFVAANLLVVLPGAALYLFLCARAAAAQLTGGFVRLGVRGLYTEERVYARGDDRVYLIGMVHVGDPSFYRAVAEAVPDDRVLVLAEGATDREGLLRGDFSYGRLADELGLESQEGFRFPPGRAVVEDADVDVSRFGPATLELLRAAGRVLGSRDPADAFAAWNRFAEVAGRPGVAEAARRDLLELRNRVLLEHLAEGLNRFDRVLVPWGAAHMPGVEAGVLDRGFRRVRTRELRVVAFPALPGLGGAPEPEGADSR